jgi:macrolide transport system ATP-binding/permease protein
MGGSNIVQNFTRDLSFGLRMLRRSPGFSLIVIVCLTLGIGANTAVFSWIEGILLRPFPMVPHQERLLMLGQTVRGEADIDDVSYPDFLDLQRNSKLIDSFIVNKITGTTLNIGDRAQTVPASIVSANYFSSLGIRPFLGREFDPSEDQGRNAHPVTVISYSLWKERFHGDENIIGKTQLLNGVPHTIIGVAPEGFYGTFVGYFIQLWVPVSMQETFELNGYQLEDRSARWIEGFALLRPGVTREQAQDELSGIAKRLEKDYPATNRGRGIRLFPLWNHPFDQAGEELPVLKISSVLAFLLLLIVCANVSNLLLVRSFVRRREMVVRLAIGAGRSRLMKQLVTEGLVLSLLAAAGGILVAYMCRNLTTILFPLNGVLTINLNGSLDLRVLVISIAVCLVSTLLFSLAPAVQNSRIDLAGALKSESGSVFGGAGRSKVQSGLVLVQVALSFVLLVGAVLLIESVRNIRAADPGFSTENLLTTSVNLVSAKYDLQRAKAFRDTLVDRLEAINGVEAASFSDAQPFSYAPFPTAAVAVEGYEAAKDEQPRAEYNMVGPEYLRTIGIPLMRGREFTRADNESSPLVAVVNEKMVAQYWHGKDPVGQRFQMDGKWVQVIGIARQAKYDALAEPAKPFFYVPLRQNSPVNASLNIRTSIGPAAIESQLVHEIHALDANLAPREIITMRTQVNRIELASKQFGVTLLGIFGVLAVLLAAVGLYGVMSYAVSQKTRELGMRMALGATTAHVLRLVLSRGFRLVALGILIGAGVTLELTRLIASLLFRVSPRDPVAFGSAALVMSVTALVALWVPAHRAAGIDPARAVRE